MRSATSAVILTAMLKRRTFVIAALATPLGRGTGFAKSNRILLDYQTAVGENLSITLRSTTRRPISGWRYEITRETLDGNDFRKLGEFRSTDIRTHSYQGRATPMNYRITFETEFAPSTVLRGEGKPRRTDRLEWPDRTYVEFRYLVL